MYCTKLFESLDKRLDEGKSIDQIGKELCDSVKNPRLKVVRLIKLHRGEDYLIENAEKLGYHPDFKRSNGRRLKIFNQEEKRKYYISRFNEVFIEMFKNADVGMIEEIFNKAFHDFTAQKRFSKA